MTMFTPSSPPPTAAETALIELAHSIGRDDFRDPAHIGTMVQLHLMTVQSRVRQLEGDKQIWLTNERPNLHGKIHELEIDRDGWSAQAHSAEHYLAWALLGIVAIGAALVVAIGASVGRVC